MIDRYLGMVAYCGDVGDVISLSDEAIEVFAN
jgi:hypothetical protein